MKTSWWKLAVSIVFAGQGMLVALAVNLSAPPADARFALQSLVLASCLVTGVLLGAPLVSATATALRNRRLTMESLFVVAIAGAMGASLQSYFTSQGPIYFEVVSVLLVIYSLNDFLRQRARTSAVAATRNWLDQLNTARVIDESGAGKPVAVALVHEGDLVEVHPGESITVDGVIERGDAYVCETSLTGEPFAQVRHPGDRVQAGNVVEDSTLIVRATAEGDSREIDGVLNAVEEARRTNISLQEQIDHWTRLFLPAVLSIAVATFVTWWVLTGWETGLFHAMSVLLVACPCALGLAVPLAVWATMSQLAHRGLVVHQADFVASLAKTDHVVFDKTGTLTEDAASLVDVAVSSDFPRDKILAWLGAVQSRSQHPVARALAVYNSTKSAEVTGLQLHTHPGRGLEATFRDCCGIDRKLRAGSPHWIDAPSQQFDQLQSQLPAAAGDLVAVEVDGKLVSICLIGERLRATANLAKQACKDLHMTVSVMTGDRPDRPSAAGFEEVTGRMSPLDKSSAIEQLQSRGDSCLFVGDGINDAAALSAATSSIALGSGADLASANAQATLLSGDLTVVPWAVERCRKAMWLVHTNLAWAAAYNVVGMLLAASGLLHPVFAALLMVGSSLIVTGRSMHFASSELPLANPGRQPAPERGALQPALTLEVESTCCCK